MGGGLLGLVMAFRCWGLSTTEALNIRQEKRSLSTLPAPACTATLKIAKGLDECGLLRRTFGAAQKGVGVVASSILVPTGMKCRRHGEVIFA